jgi:hypothetical protein
LFQARRRLSAGCVTATAKAAMTTAEATTTGIRCEDHERNSDQQHRGNCHAGRQHRLQVPELSQFRFCDLAAVISNPTVGSASG